MKSNNWLACTIVHKNAFYTKPFEVPYDEMVVLLKMNQDSGQQYVTYMTSYPRKVKCK